MKLRLLSVEEVDKTLNHPIEHGIIARLMERSDKAKSTREKRIYGCRHCEGPQHVEQIVAPGVVAIRPAETVSTSGSRILPSVGNAADSASQSEMGARGSQLGAGVPTAKKAKALPLFTFDGLRSHAIKK